MGAVRRADRAGEWWIDFRYRGRRIRRPAPDGTRRGAEALERTLRKEFAEDENRGIDPLSGPPPTLAEFAERWFAEYVAVANRHATRRSKEFAFRLHILPALGGSRLDEITAPRIDSFTAALRRRDLSPKTVNNILSMLRCALTTAVRWRLLRGVPEVRWLRAPTPEVNALSAEEVTRILGVLPAGYWRAFVTLIARTGLRFGEAAALRWDSFELGRPDPIARISHGVSHGVLGPTKTAKTREVPLGPDVVEALTAFRHDDPFLFTQRNGTFPRPESELKYLHRFCDKAGVRRISWHGLRHSFATELASRGASLRTLQDLLGHTTLQMTSRYLHVAPRMLHETVALLYAPAPARLEWNPNGHQASRGNMWSPGATESVRQNFASHTEKPALRTGSSVDGFWSG